ncbi:Protein of unknown function (DUF664) [Saccharomonospora xinjiangensis XJ-54]|uniref:Mini-circle protein n=1 Tax=Saccharomonospora xinjiangensis XJ-54 TaxID=882086 RepID=I0V6B8_9PSEU|nr:Protein of unknown function (DUF664) [Saccharomonospora xinjiangensis XJ-54]
MLVSKIDTRPEPPYAGSERETLNGFLDFLRATIRWKCHGLSDEQARRALLPSELTTVAGLVGHLSYVERYWFEVVLAGEPDTWKDRLAADPDAEFREALDVPLAALLDEYERQCERSRRIAGERELDDEVPFRGCSVSVRYVLTHLIEETGRHAGHLDVLRELIDGRTGE